ncbi:MAG: hypothetical protein JO030_02185 [Candidatus Eremiobacteraeota bacterium]|nr:hypothetical protein [Candidatus Eremiobacteraeota bacterium]
MLDHYLEGALRPRKTVEVATHVSECRRCAALLEELRVIDGLLVTARPPVRITPDFTQAVVGAAAKTTPRAVRRMSLSAALLIYLAVAWACAAYALTRLHAASSVGALVASEQQSLLAAEAALRAVAPAVPLAAAMVTAVLLLDLFLLGALVYGYRRLRPAVAPHVIRGSRS